MSPNRLRPFLVNLLEVSIYFLRGVQADAVANGTQENADLLQRLLAYRGVPALLQVPGLEEQPSPVLEMYFPNGQTSPRLFTTVTTLGTPQDVTVQEPRIECFFPADGATA